MSQFKKTKLELTWIGKENRPRLEPRILLEDPEKSYHSAHMVTDHDRFDNRLICADNLLALRALEQEFTGKVKLVFIDPPYNTGSAFEHYDDGLEHSLWLSMMRDRLELLRRLLSDDGSIWITIDDNEAHYLKVMLDEIFGRTQFLGNVLWQKVYSDRMDARELSVSHDHILAYKRSESFSMHRLRIDQQEKQFTFFDEARGKFYRRRSLRKEGSSSLRRDRPNLWYPLSAPDGTSVYPVKPTGVEGNWRWSSDTYEGNAAKDMVEWVMSSRGTWEVYVKQYKDDDASRPPNTWWTCDDVGHNHEAKEEARRFNADNVFATPKPERLIRRILEIATSPGDLVLDSFLGSGTTAAVAHKIGRRWIGIELGEHAVTHCLPRLKKVIDGEDAGGITDAVDWKGGGGFRFYRLAASLLEKDKWGQWVISSEYNASMLAEAACKLEGFTYAPSDVVYWQHGHSTERDFIYVTTQQFSADQLAQLSDDVGPERSLLVLCAAFRVPKGGSDRYPNLTVKKIPKQVLSRCEWGHDDYSLKVENLTAAPAPPPTADQRGQIALI